MDRFRSAFALVLSASALPASAGLWSLDNASFAALETKEVVLWFTGDGASVAAEMRMTLPAGYRIVRTQQVDSRALCASHQPGQMAANIIDFQQTLPREAIPACVLWVERNGLRVVPGFAEMPSANCYDTQGSAVRCERDRGYFTPM